MQAPSSVTDIVLGLAQATASAPQPAERQFILLNASRQAWPYQVALRWRGQTLSGHSGAGSIDTEGPYAQWLQRLAPDLLRLPTGPVTAAGLGSPEAGSWAEWWPAHGLWLNASHGPGGWLLLRDLPFTAGEQSDLQRWWDLWQAIDAAATVPSTGAWWQGWHGQPRRRRRQLLAAGAGLLALMLLPVHLTVRAPGELVPREPLILRAAAEGTVRLLKVQPNQSVKAGTVLAELDDATWASRLEVARQALATADAEWRQIHLLALNDVRAKGQLAAAQGKVEERRTDVAYLEQQVRRTTLVAPRDGVVLIQDPGSWPGRTVAAGEPVMKLAQPQDQAIEAWLAPGDAVDLPAGTPMRLYLASGAGEAIEGRLHSYAYEAEQRADHGLGYRVRGDLDHPGTQRLGARGTVHIDGPRVPLIYWVLRRPLAALRETLAW